MHGGSGRWCGTGKRRPTVRVLAEAGRQFVRFGVVQLRCCAFALALVAGIAASRLLPEGFPWRATTSSSPTASC